MTGISKSWRSTGLWPVNREKVLRKIKSVCNAAVKIRQFVAVHEPLPVDQIDERGLQRLRNEDIDFAGFRAYSIVNRDLAKPSKVRERSPTKTLIKLGPRRLLTHEACMAEEEKKAEEKRREAELTAALARVFRALGVDPADMAPTASSSGGGLSGQASAASSPARSSSSARAGSTAAGTPRPGDAAQSAGGVPPQPLIEAMRGHESSGTPATSRPGSPGSSQPAPDNSRGRGQVMRRDALEQLVRDACDESSERILAVLGSKLESLGRLSVNLHLGPSIRGDHRVGSRLASARNLDEVVTAAEPNMNVGEGSTLGMATMRARLHSAESAQAAAENRLWSQTYSLENQKVFLKNANNEIAQLKKEVAHLRQLEAHYIVELESSNAAVDGLIECSERQENRVRVAEDSQARRLHDLLARSDAADDTAPARLRRRNEDLKEQVKWLTRANKTLRAHVQLEEMDPDVLVLAVSRLKPYRTADRPKPDRDIAEDLARTAFSLNDSIGDPLRKDTPAGANKTTPGTSATAVKKSRASRRSSPFSRFSSRKTSREDSGYVMPAASPARPSRSGSKARKTSAESSAGSSASSSPVRKSSEKPKKLPKKWKESRWARSRSASVPRGSPVYARFIGSSVSPPTSAAPVAKATAPSVPCSAPPAASAETPVQAVVPVSGSGDDPQVGGLSHRADRGETDQRSASVEQSPEVPQWFGDDSDAGLTEGLVDDSVVDGGAASADEEELDEWEGERVEVVAVVPAPSPPVADGLSSSASTDLSSPAPALSLRLLFRLFLQLLLSRRTPRSLSHRFTGLQMQHLRRTKFKFCALSVQPEMCCPLLCWIQILNCELPTPIPGDARIAATAAGIKAFKDFKNPDHPWQQLCRRLPEHACLFDTHGFDPSVKVSQRAPPTTRVNGYWSNFRGYGDPVDIDLGFSDWERYHWIPAPAVDNCFRIATKELEGNNWSPEAKAKVRAELDEAKAEWLAYATERNKRWDRFRAEIIYQVWRWFVSKEPKFAALHTESLFEPSMLGCPFDNLTWLPKTTDWVSEISALDAAEPWRNGWVDVPAQHPYNTTFFPCNPRFPLFVPTNTTREEVGRQIVVCPDLTPNEIAADWDAGFREPAQASDESSGPEPSEPPASAATSHVAIDNSDHLQVLAQAAASAELQGDAREDGDD
ncbi:hypothetical protein PHYSODRAFT_334895 [Phytophthora sojae]|uniref:Uncharacterized protein n=1 Tax=Phytophthora sojae (strain P6497) TaxID=1094619 RepID=G4ZT53_PHYSP|nr:hypothetical protein PHYSODRAFT_334895 [Phytophthora sojae]EGZ13085.1 hypothetical protein PHYSODRAFT_334895 [Phytophthora sojae]|eukprot:XP_009530514.1 hypothetical protein PHYSODRAFT_334895 [Phytophthora sojae]